LHILPEVVGIEKAGNFRINVDDVNVAFAAVADDRLVVVTCFICLDIDTKRPVNF
jgi:hypothetical protein